MHTMTEVVDGQKACSDCLLVQPLENFTPQKSGLGGRAAQCRPCRNIKQRGFYLSPEASRKYSLKKNYGITPEDFDLILEEQDGCCQICRTEPVGEGHLAVLHVDHDHLTGANRSLLCSQCNLGLGQFRDDPELLMRAASYLLFWREATEGIAA